MERQSNEEKLESLLRTRQEILEHPGRHLLKSFLIPGYLINQAVAIPKGVNSRMDKLRTYSIRYALGAEVTKLMVFGCLVYEGINHFQ